jgi:hypothetical protein
MNEKGLRIGRRFAATTATVLAGTAMLAAPALAEQDYIGIFIPESGQTTVYADSDTYNGVNPHIEIVRGGTVIARSSGFYYGSFGSVDVASLNAGDTINLLRNNAVVASTVFDGTPTINADACAGQSTFTGSRNALAEIESAGAYTPRRPYGDPIRAIWTKVNPFTVTLDTPLAAGQIAYVSTSWRSGSLYLESSRRATVGNCPAPPPPPPATPAVPTDAQVLAAVKAALGKTGAKLRTLDPAALAKRKSVSLPFAFSEAGTAKLQLTTKVKRKGKKAKTMVVGSGTKKLAAAGSANVPVKFTKAGRSLLKRSKSLKLTLKGTFTPARAGAKPQSASTSATLKRKKKK